MTRSGCLILLSVLSVVLLGAGCAPMQQAYYVSPFNGNNSEYHPIPRQDDTAHAALYAGTSFFKGSANNNNTDDYWGMHTSLFAAHSYSHIQFYYGGNLSLGNFHMGHWPYSTTVPSIYNLGANYANTDQLNTYAGGHSFGGAGFAGGINGVIPIGIGEWRVLGVETSVTHEFGNYLSVRKRMPDSIATQIIRDATFATVGLSSELVAHLRDGELGFRWAYGWSLGQNYLSSGILDNTTQSDVHYTYFNFSFHYTYQRLTAFVQFNQATKSSGGQAGICFRLTGAGRWPKDVDALDDLRMRHFR
jgi:hypothetical protein